MTQGKIKSILEISYIIINTLMLIGVATNKFDTLLACIICITLNIFLKEFTRELNRTS